MTIINKARPFNVGDEIYAGPDQPARQINSWNPARRRVTVMDSRGRMLDISWNEALVLLVRKS